MDNDEVKLKDLLDRTIAALYYVTDGDFNSCTTDDDAGDLHHEWLSQNIKRIKCEDKKRKPDERLLPNDCL